jgi:hypothetical protein
LRSPVTIALDIVRRTRLPAAEPVAGLSGSARFRAVLGASSRPDPSGHRMRTLLNSRSVQGNDACQPDRDDCVAAPPLSTQSVRKHHERLITIGLNTTQQHFHVSSRSRR